MYQPPPTSDQPPQPPQQPYYPPMQPSPQMQPPRKRRTWLWITLGVIALLLFACIGTVVLVSKGASQLSSSNSGTVANTTPSAPTQAPTQPPTQQHFKVGQTVKVGDTWQVTVNSAKTSQGSEFSTPAANHVYLVIDVTLKNISTQEQQAYSAQFTLRDATGQQYTETFFDSSLTSPNGKVEADGLLRGQLSYEVPTSQKHFTLAFEASLTETGQTIWDIDV
jgi:hypothetical protein